MSLKPTSIPEIPEETARVARRAFPRGNVVMQLRDTLGTIYTDDLFADLFPSRGQPAEAPWRLALVTVLQFMEHLTDCQAADAVRDRLAWKYALSLELSDPGFDHSVLSEFRTRLVEHIAEERLLDALLDLCKERGWLKARGKQRTDSTHVLAKIRALNRLECVGETMFHTLNVLAQVAPDWLRMHADPAWAKRYDHRMEDYRLPTSKEERLKVANEIGADGWKLLSLLSQEDAPAWLKELPTIQTLRWIWEQQFHPVAEGGTFRTNETLVPAGQMHNSPYDLDASYAKKRHVTWVGYKVHFTETCDEQVPHLITQVTTTDGTVTDDTALTDIQEGLEHQELLPEQHLVDAGYVDAHLLVSSQTRFDVDLVGPTRGDHKWQARQQTGFDASHFQIDWDKQQAVCPQGQVSMGWMEAYDGDRAVVKVKFSYAICRRCPCHDLCTRSGRRTLTLRPRAEYEALQVARQREKTEAFTDLRARRAGVEGTHAQAVRRCGVRRSRYIGQPRTHLQMVGIATALNVLRIEAWVMGTPTAKTRQPLFATLMAQLAS